ncbi:MAG: hypothetical protein AAFZ18_03095 [Myxococcota bacterium]
MLSKRILKILHELGTVGVMGALAAQMVLAVVGAGLDPEGHAVLRQAIHVLARTLLLPSLMVCLVSGVFAMAFHRPFLNAEWAIAKALMIPLLLEGTFLVVMTPAKTAAKLTARIAEGDASEKVQHALDVALGRERYGAWVIMAMFFAQIVLGVWRPRMRPRPAPSTEAGGGPSASSEASTTAG